MKKGNDSCYHPGKWGCTSIETGRLQSSFKSNLFANKRRWASNINEVVTVIHWGDTGVAEIAEMGWISVKWEMFLCIVVLTCDSPILICLSADVGNAPVCTGHDGCVGGDVKKDCLSWNLTLWLRGWGGRFIWCWLVEWQDTWIINTRPPRSFLFCVASSVSSDPVRTVCRPLCCRLGAVSSAVCRLAGLTI